MAAAGITGRVQESIEAAGIETEVWDRARVEPTDSSFAEAAAFAVDGGSTASSGSAAGRASTPPRSPT